MLALGAQAGHRLAGRLGQSAAARGARVAGGRHRRGASCIGAGHSAERAAGSTGCALGALGLFSTRFDSVLFLSQIFGHFS